MMCKMSSILLVVAAVVVLVAGDCMQTIQDARSKTNGRPLMGGYRPMDDPEKDEVVKKMVADSIKVYNQRSNDLFQYKDSRKYNCETQVVNGVNYCCGFQITSDGCKNGSNSEVCEKETKLACTAKGYKPFSDQYVTINQDSVQCTKIV